MRNILLLIVVVMSALTGVACGGAGNTNANGTAQQTKDCPPTSDTPTEAYKRLYAAVKAKNTDAIKGAVSKQSQELAGMMAEKQKNPVEKAYENGFTATTFSPTLPEIRDERIGGCWAGLEVRNTKEEKWEDLPFVIEDGTWKLAIGELFGGSFKSPGKGQDTKDKEAANAMRGDIPPVNMMANNNTSTMANVKGTPAPKYTGPEVEPLPKKK